MMQQRHKWQKLWHLCPIGEATLELSRKHIWDRNISSDLFSQLQNKAQLVFEVAVAVTLCHIKTVFCFNRASSRRKVRTQEGDFAAGARRPPWSIRHASGASVAAAISLCLKVLERTRHLRMLLNRRLLTVWVRLKQKNMAECLELRPPLSIFSRIRS